MQRNGPISSWDQQGEANWSEEVRERERESRNFILQHKKLLKGRRGSGKKQEEVEFSKSAAVIIGNKNDF